MDDIIFTDRYGGNWPDIETMCDGDCEGTGWVPVKKDDDDESYRLKWLDAEAKLPNEPDDLGYHFVTCNKCNGTGLKI